MMPVEAANPLMERVYGAAVRLYPAAFREAHAGAMRQTFRDALRDPGFARSNFIPLVVRDLFTSLAKEHLVMLSDTFVRPTLIYNVLVLTGISTVLALALYAIPQQVIRLGANDPQIAMAGDLAARLEGGVAASEAVPAGSVDMTRSLTPFVIVYDDQGKPLASQAQLNGQTPTPPAGVFDFVRTHGEDRITWRPEAGVRMAAVVKRVEGAHAGFVLAGRSLREEETRQTQVGQMAWAAWMGMMGMILVGTAVFGWVTRVRVASARG